MMRRTTARIAWGAVLSAAVVGCSDPAAPEPTTPTFAEVYTTRGIVERLPDPQRVGSDLHIQHEQIPEFVGRDGQVVGMRSMTMPFPTLAPDVSLDGLAVGDKVRFTFGVTWSQGTTGRVPTWTVTHIEELPPDTELDLGPRPPAGGAPSPEPTGG